MRSGQGTGGQAAVTPQTTNTATNNQVAGSGFKRQNTVDSATIKENSVRLNQRPNSAQPKAQPNENSKFVRKHMFDFFNIFLLVRIILLLGRIILFTYLLQIRTTTALNFGSNN